MQGKILKVNILFCELFDFVSNDLKCNDLDYNKPPFTRASFCLVYQKLKKIKNIIKDFIFLRNCNKITKYFCCRILKIFQNLK